MGKLINGINGAIVGKVGSISGSSWKGIPHIKGPYKKRTKKVSPEEMANRNKFASSQFWLQPLLGFVRQGFKGHSINSEGFNAAKSYLLKNCFEDEVINPALVKLSGGSLPLSANIQAALIADDQISFSWDGGSTDREFQDDQAMLVAYDVDNKNAYYTITGQFRKTGQDILQINGAKGRTYHLYLAFSAADRSRQSESVYLGEVKTQEAEQPLVLNQQESIKRAGKVIKNKAKDSGHKKKSDKKPFLFILHGYQKTGKIKAKPIPWPSTDLLNLQKTGL